MGHQNPFLSEIDRRRFLARAGQIAGIAGMTAVSGAAPTLAACSRQDDSPEGGAVTPPLYQISLAEWSLHRALRSGKITNLDFPVVAARDLDIHAIEYVNSFFKDKARDTTYLDDLKKRCADEGVESVLIMIDGEGSLAAAKDAERKQAIENHHRWIDAAAHLGCHSIRVNARGDGERDEVAKRAADSLRSLAEHGAPKKISVIVENHGGVSSDGAWLASVMRQADHPGVGTLPDFGNFHIQGDQWYDRYRGVEELMPFAKAVSAKSHEFNDDGEEVRTDYRRMMKIVVAAGYRGYVGVEYEGDQHPEDVGIRKTRDLLLKIRGELEAAAG